MKQQYSAGKSKRKISHDPAHRPKQSHLAADPLCVLCPERRIKSRTMPAGTLLPELLTTRGAPEHRAECAKIRLSPQNVGKRDLVGACRASAPWPKCCDSSYVSLRRRKKTTLYSRNTKRFSEKQLDRATRQETVMPDRNNTNQVQRRRFPPEPRHSPCQYGWVLAAATSLLSQKSAGAELLAPQSKRFSDDFAPAERRQ